MCIDDVITDVTLRCPACRNPLEDDGECLLCGHRADRYQQLVAWGSELLASLRTIALLMPNRDGRDGFEKVIHSWEDEFERIKKVV
jgi:hypothetical protein